jgi:prepilin-type N-terminal cleavage/methylation domain-containing protein
MLQKIKNRKESGFTIIEVLIVLAIAGLILLVVFLAVPALQRNSRNTQAKNAASAILGAVSEYTNNNNGALPNTAAVSGTTVTLSDSTTTTETQATAKIQGGYAVNATGTMPTTPGTFVLSFAHTCNGNAFSTTTTPRAVAIGFVIESGSGNAAQCVES